jgi:pimeloyl-ACP methyl ester carboxylesterase
MAAVQEYKIHVPGTDLEKLEHKLGLTDWPKAAEGSDTSSWDQGVPILEIKRLVHAWRTDFDWRVVETRLNKLPNFIANVSTSNFGTLDVHFIHKKSSRSTAIPLLFLHGWPGSFIEVTKILDDLAAGGEGVSFHVVAPSLIDFGFSSASPVGQSTFNSLFLC